MKRRKKVGNLNVSKLKDLYGNVYESNGGTFEITPDAINKTLDDRKSTHGEFHNNALVSQLLKDVIRSGANWEQLNNIQRESLEMIVHKIARILNGNPNHKDHWHDIAGYAQLVEDRI